MMDLLCYLKNSERPWHLLGEAYRQWEFDAGLLGLFELSNKVRPLDSDSDSYDNQIF